MDADALSGVLQLVLPPAVGAVVTITVGGVARRVRTSRTDARAAAPKPPFSPTSVSTLRPGTAAPATPAATSAAAPTVEPSARRGRLRRWVGGVWELIDGLPPLKRRASLWKATLIGSVGFGFGVAGYFRTRADVLIGLLLTTPFFVGLPFTSATDTGESSGEPTGPYWAYALAYTSMGLTGVYSYLRAVSSNRHLDEALPSTLARKEWDERRDILDRELRLLVGSGWTIESVSGVQATVSRVRRPNHVLHLVLTLLTFYLWGIVWIARTLKARRLQEREYRLVSVDEFGHWSVEPLPTAASLSR
ncbi:MAG TPA: hypothetical protein VLB86_07080 [Gaiellaceae bacterium]|nr:hypothetical protein [Gaiellaceae bacterium]